MADEVAHCAYRGENPEVDLWYINVKSGRETCRRLSLDKAIWLAEQRKNDGRYRNFEFHIG